MIRNVSLEEISDGKLYGSNDMVKVGCNDCNGCSVCCQGMGNSILLDPLDCSRLTHHLNTGMEQLLEHQLELNVVDGIILPNLKMAGEKEACSFLNTQGRCSIHDVRPGMCRLFPLGRYYENHGFQYIVLTGECVRENKTKIKVKKWLDMTDLKSYEKFITDWHYFLLEIQDLLKNQKPEIDPKRINLYILQNFFMMPFLKQEDFYEEFEKRLETAKGVLLNQN